MLLTHQFNAIQFFIFNIEIFHGIQLTGRVEHCGAHASLICSAAMHYSSLFHAFSEWIANSISIRKFTHIIQSVRLYVFLQDTGALREIHFTKVSNVNLMALINDTLPCEIILALQTIHAQRSIWKDSTEKEIMTRKTKWAFVRTSWLAGVSRMLTINMSSMIWL